MILLHDADAQHRQLTIVHACGFDSIPSDIGTHFTMTQVRRMHGERVVVSRMEGIFTLSTGELGMVGNIGTWRSLVHSFSGRKALLNIRKELRSKYASEGGAGYMAGVERGCSGEGMRWEEAMVADTTEERCGGFEAGRYHRPGYKWVCLSISMADWCNTMTTRSDTSSTHISLSRRTVLP